VQKGPNLILMPVRPTRCSKLCHLLLKYLIGEDMECGGFLFEMSVSFKYLPKKGIGVVVFVPQYVNAEL